MSVTEVFGHMALSDTAVRQASLRAGTTRPATATGWRYLCTATEASTGHFATAIKARDENVVRQAWKPSAPNQRYSVGTLTPTLRESVLTHAD